ncbi:alpha/beta-hydrolase [Clavulina sp. PMI_390]|nr:alpha/beta-hydrolase [Clavulina sp. PMI_390]
MPLTLEQEAEVVIKQWVPVYRQPWKTFYLTFQFSFLFLILTPLRCVMFFLPALRPRPKWTWLQSTFVLLIHDLVPIATNAGIVQSRKDVRKVDMPSPKRCGRNCQGVFLDPLVADDIVGEVKELMIHNDVRPAGVAIYWHGDGVGTRPIAPAADDEKIIVHFHGGGYVLGSARAGGIHESLPRSMLAQAQAHPSKPISRIINVEYRLVRTFPLAEPANAFPAALLDAATVIYYLVFDVGFHPRNILLSGDSAGANVALSVTRYLRDASMPASRLKEASLPAHLEGVTSLMPGGLILISPWCDVAATHIPERAGPNCSFVRNARTDIVEHHLYSKAHPEIGIFSYGMRGLAGKALTLHSIARNPFVSPGSLDCPLTAVDPRSGSERATFEGYPPAYFSFGGKEILNDEIWLCGQRLAEHSAAKFLPPRKDETTPEVEGSSGRGQPKEHPWIVMDEEPEMWHDFVPAPAAWKEGQRTLERMTEWLAALPPATEYPV